MLGRRPSRSGNSAAIDTSVTSGLATPSAAVSAGGRLRTAHLDRRVVLALALATVAAVAAGIEPKLAVVGVVAIALMAVLVANVTAGLMVFVVVAFLESLPSIGGAPSLAKLAGLLLVIGWLGVVAFGESGDTSSVDFLSRNAVLASTLGLFLVWVFFSQMWAEDVGVARETAFRYALNFALFPIVFVAIRNPRHVVWLYSTFVIGGLAVAGVGLGSSGGLGTGEGRLAGAGLNPNQLGALLAVGAALAAVLAFYGRLSGAVRVLALFASGLCAVLVVMTVSRGALLGLVTSLIVAPVLAGPGRRLAAAAIVAGGGLAMTVWLMLAAPEATVQRLTHTSGGSGRIDLWTIGLRMIDDRPFTGVGAGNFPVSSVHYLLQPGLTTRDQYIIDEPKVTHNIYLQVLSELGFVGITLFVASVLLCLIIGLGAARAFRRQGDRDSELLARGLLIALVGLLVADFLSSELYSKQLYVLLATAPALFAIAAREAKQAP